MKRGVLFCTLFFVSFVPSLLFSQIPTAETLGPGFNIGGFSTSLNLLLSLGSISFVPFFLVSSTCFLRLVIVLSLTRQAIGVQTAPPNMTLVALAMFMTVFVMTPVWREVNDAALKPYRDGSLNQKEAIDIGLQPFRNYMLKFIREKDLALFLEFSQIEYTQNIDEVPLFILIPAYMISELKTAFQIGFLLFIPFVVIDLIVSNVLLSLGMFMLSPAMISMPFKILLFVLSDGWNLIAQGLLISLR